MRKFRGYMRFMRRKILRDPMPPENVAAGWALGMFVGCAIPFGLQLVVSVPLAVLMKVSKIGATFGTLITNPVTIVFIYPLQTWAVNTLLFGGSLSLSNLMSTDWTWEAVCDFGPKVMASFFLGGISLAAIMTPITYFVVLGIVLEARKSKAARVSKTEEK